MRKNILKKTIGIFGIIIITMLLLTCYDAFHVQNQQGKAVVSFSVTDNTMRTVFPQVALDDVALYKLHGERDGETETELLEFNTGSTSLALEPGTWNFTLNAYNEDEELILQGNVQNKQITLTGTNQVNFTLSTVKSGTGNIQITINFPEEAGITLIKTTGDIDAEEFTDFSNGNFVYTKNNVAAGDLFINFDLYREDLLQTTVSELILVRKNLTSSKIITLAGENLKPVPTYGIEIDFTGIVEWELIEQTAIANVNEDKVFTVNETYTSYQWYLDGVSVGTTSSYTLNEPAGVYQLVVVVTNNTGESRSGRCRVTVGVAPLTYTVTFNVNSGSGTEPISQTVEAGFGIILPSGSGFTRTNFTFGGWNTNSSGTGTNYNAGSSFIPTANITLFARWTWSTTVFSEYFEGTHSFTLVNNGQTNRWRVGRANYFEDLRYAYISNGGTSNAYTVSSASTVHMYRDVTFPASTTPYTLSFHWRGQGENGHDHLRVFLIETTDSLSAGIVPSATALGTYSMGGASTWNRAIISIPASNSGTTKRLVFTWVNDNSQGTQPPAAVTSIQLTR